MRALILRRARAGRFGDTAEIAAVSLSAFPAGTTSDIEAEAEQCRRLNDASYALHMLAGGARICALHRRAQCGILARPQVTAHIPSCRRSP